MHFVRYSFILLGFCMITAGIPSPACAKTVIRIGGSGTGTGAMKMIAAAFEKNNPGITAKVMPSLGSSGGIKALLGGALDIALSARPLKDGEETKSARIALQYRTPFVIMVNKSVNKTDINTNELEDILTGRLTTWTDGKPVRLILRPEGDTDTKLIQAISPEISQAMKIALSSPNRHIALTDQDADRDINTIPGALGFSTTAQIKHEKLSAKALSFNKIHPSTQNLKKGSYPLAKEIFVVLKGSGTTPEITKFISFLKSPSATRLLEKNSIIISAP